VQSRSLKSCESLLESVLMRIDTTKKHAPRVETVVQFESFLQLSNCLVVPTIEIISDAYLSINS
jgi:hypothetical protein